MNQSKIAFITGGSRGLGKNMALSLAKKGIDVILTYNTKKEEAEKVVNEIKLLGQKASILQLDMSKSGEFTTFVKAVRRELSIVFKSDKVNFLINNAGIGIYNYFPETTEEQFDELMNIHFKGSFFLTQKLLPLLENGGGIINVSTGLTRFSFPGYAAYAAMKGAIEVLTRYQAKELAQRKIRVNTVAPGAIETDFGDGTVRDNKEINEFISSVTTLGRVGMPNDIGGVIAFLCSDDAYWINAQRIEVSGGMML
ncbi:SDR family NAD(P)-dependent oxidoreductase [Aquimarina megaterium]|uniref:SDR family NAD(P)-dependent oxidoreductase n=1 Tax=Aquimarina megaterium TaxID=1443666 RepID=UPI0009424400|nr:SDR family oxidoreductase [Aquimarina megaterium]